MFLQKLDEVERTMVISENHLLFNMDIVALYDSLHRNQVEAAIRHSIAVCRPNWPGEFVDWLMKSLVGIGINQKMEGNCVSMRLILQYFGLLMK